MQELKSAKKTTVQQKGTEQVFSVTSSHSVSGLHGRHSKWKERRKLEAQWVIGGGGGRW